VRTDCGANRQNTLSAPMDLDCHCHIVANDHLHITYVASVTYISNGFSLNLPHFFWLAVACRHQPSLHSIKSLPTICPYVCLDHSYYPTNFDGVVNRDSRRSCMCTYIICNNIVETLYCIRAKPGVGVSNFRNKHIDLTWIWRDRQMIKSYRN
jgi:hypothetical protein